MPRSPIWPACALALSLTLGGCGSGSDGAPDGGGGGDALDSTSGLDATPIPIDPTPILERTPRLEATCAITADLEILGSNLGGPALVDGEPTPKLAYVQAGVPGGLNRVEVAPLATTPELALGAADVSITSSYANRLVTGFRHGEDTVLVWLNSSAGAGDELLFVRVDPDGAPVAPPRALAGLTFDYGERPRVFTRGDGLGLAWVDGDYPDQRLKAVQLDADGAALGEPSDLGPARELGDLVTLEDGSYLLAFTTLAGSFSTEVRTVRLAADLTPLAPSRPASPAANDELAFGSPSLLPRGDGFLLALVEARVAYQDETGHEVVALAHLDADGAVVGSLHRLTAPVEDVSHVRPVLFDRGAHVGLAWSAGNIIYICAGCMPDHVLRVVMLDDEVLVPVSTPIELVGASGLFTAGLGVVGDDLLALFEVVYHVHADAAAALLRCQ